MQLFFQKDSTFKEVYVKGEVSGAKISKSGHIYFSLKDKSSIIPCIIYRKNRRYIDFEITDGMNLFVIADVRVYLPHGKYQLDVGEAFEDGLGKLYVKLQKLKEKLTKEGLFDLENKKPLPDFPKSIGVITSKEGSVIHDILKTVNQKWPYSKIYIFPSQVQGASATNQLIRQIKRADSFNLDVLIIARGGGSIEDLWCFNEESLVRCIFNTNTPIISAIGHESDDTLCDLASDKRASNPTAAANIAINDKNQVKSQVNQYNIRLINYISSKLVDHKKQFNYMLSNQLFCDSTYVYKDKKSHFNDLSKRFEYSSCDLLNQKRNMLSKITSSYVIRHPCKMQLDTSRHKLNKLQSRLINAMDLIIKTNRHNLDKTTEEFKFSSNNFLSNQRFMLNQVKSSYSIENPCKIQLEKSYLRLNNSKSQLIDEINLIVNSNHNNLDKTINKFKFLSNNYLTSQRFRLNQVKSSYCIENPCKIQLDKSYLRLNNSKSQLIDEINLIIKSNHNNLDKMIDKFKFSSNNLILNQKLRLNQSRSSLDSLNPSKTHIEKYGENLQLLKSNIIKSFNHNIERKENDFNNLLKNNLFKNPDLIYKYKSDNLEKLTNKFINKSNELILTKSYKLDSIKNKNVLKNPNLILDKPEYRLNVCKEKLDKINQVLKLRQEQDKQKSKYRKIIIAIIVMVIIIILLIYGGI